MSSKLEAYLQNYRNGQLKNIKLPNINNHSPLIDKKIINKITQIKKQQNTQSHLTYSRIKHYQNPIKLLNNIKRIATQQSLQDYNQLSKIQKNIMMQIQDIDICLESQRNIQQQKHKTSLFQGYIFLNQVNDFVVQKFHDCLQIQAQASNAIIDGFDVPRLVIGTNGQQDVVDANIVNKIASINHKMLDKSINAIKQYDIQKHNEYEKNYGKQWSLFKRDLPITIQRPEKQLQKLLLKTDQNDSKLTFIKSFKSRIKNQSKSTNLFQSKLTYNSKNTFIGDVSFIKRSRQTKISKNQSTRVKTQPIQNQQNQHKMIVKLTRKDVKMMLNKHKNIVSVWIPPASYPQFFGIFSYKIIKIQKSQLPNSTIYKCKINRYFFYKFGLSRKVFNAILQWVSYECNILIDSLEITMDKSLYSHLFEKMGWILKFWESANKVKASFYGTQKQEKQSKN